MSVDWSLITIEHVQHACDLYDARKELPVRPAVNTFLIMNGKHYPAKFIRGLAYRLATNRTLDPNIDYEGGKPTAVFFSKLGLMAEYKGVVLEPVK